MRRISIIVHNSITCRLFLRTPFFDLLKSNPQNRINIFILTNRIKKEVKAENVKVKSFQNWLWIRKLGIKRERLFFILYKLFGVFNSELIMLSNWQEEELRQIVSIAKERHIPTLFVEEGIADAQYNELAGIYPDRIAVWGDYAKKIYTSKGFAEEDIVVTGPLRFDWYHNLANKKIINSDKKILLYGTQFANEETRYFKNYWEVVNSQIDIMLEVCKIHNMQLVLKLHPSDRKENYQRDGVIILEETGTSEKNFVRWYCADCFDPKVPDIMRTAQILLNSSIVVTMHSTLCFEAMLLDRPAIFFDLGGFSSNTDYCRMQDIMAKCDFAVARTKERFEELVNRYIKDPQSDKPLSDAVLKEIFYKVDGAASRRLLDAAEELLIK